MVLLTSTPRLKSAIQAYNALPSVTEPIDDLTPSLPHEQIHAIAQALQAAHPSQRRSYAFSSLLLGSSVYIPPPPPPPPKSPEYTALMTRLRREAEEREYSRLTTGTEAEAYDEEMTWADVKRQLTVIFNVLLSTIATAAAVWKVAGGWDTPQRLGAAFAAALVVAVAEVALFGGYVRRLEEAATKEGEKKERKVETGVKWVVGREGVKEKVG
jgi:hypothetical protein